MNDSGLDDPKQGLSLVITSWLVGWSAMAGRSSDGRGGMFAMHTATWPPQLSCSA